MQTKFYRAAWDSRQLLQLAPALCMALVWAGLWIWGDRQQFRLTGGVLGLMVVFWLGLGLWRVLTEGYRLEEGCLVITAGPQRIRIRYGSIVRVMAGDVTLPESRMARGALLVEQEGASRGQLLYPRELQELIQELKARAPGAVYVTNELELEALRRKGRKK